MTRRRFTLLQKGLLLLGIPLVYQIILFSVLFHQQRETARAEWWAVHTKEVLDMTGEIEITLVQGQSDGRGALLTRDPGFRARAEAALDKLPILLRELGWKVSDNAGQTSRLLEVEQAQQAWKAWSKSIFALTDAGNMERALAMVRSLQGQQLVDGVLDPLGRFRKVERTIDWQRAGQVDAARHRESLILAAGLGLNVAIVLGAGFVFGRSILRRLGVVTENVTRVRTGDGMLPRRSGANDEISDLDSSFREMSESLAAAREKGDEAAESLKQSNAELSRANLDLDQKNRDNEMFVYSVSHDLRSPLVNLQGFSKELGMARDEFRTLIAGEWAAPTRQRASRLVEREMSESIHFIQTAVIRLSTIIDALLRLSRAGQVEYHPEMVNSGLMIRRIVDAMRDTCGKRSAEVTIEDLPPVWGDPTTLDQIFANLIGNALNYLDPARPGRVSIGCRAAESRDAAEEKVLFVRDNGLGIAEAHMGKVFAIFQRLHATAAAGEGVGLALVRRMVDRHGGRIWVESTEGAGSTFFVALPERSASPLELVPKEEAAIIPLSHPNPTSHA